MSGSAAISVEGVSKRYRLGLLDAKTLREDVQRRWMKLRGKEDPLADVATNELTNVEGQHVWALRDIDFSVGKGTVLGLIGRNGAGKSTLLKILTRITAPTTGCIRMRGRVASMLEVGTGFHQELTGRENVHLNGVILGMTKADVAARFDEIVEFAGVGAYIDTPVKRYSSGMTVRLAFAVAAHLEPEILLIDEVLAVGDADFQKKCIGKMDEVSAEGRTVVLVSHNMHTIHQLTRRCLLLKSGRIAMDGPPERVVEAYLAEGSPTSARRAEYRAPVDSEVAGSRIVEARVVTSREGGKHDWGEPLRVDFALQVDDPRETLCFGFQIMDGSRRPVCHFWLYDGDLPFRHRAGTFALSAFIPKLRLFMGSYDLDIWIAERRGDRVLEHLEAVCRFDVEMWSTPREHYDWKPRECVYLEDFSWAPITHMDVE